MQMVKLAYNKMLEGVVQLLFNYSSHGSLQQNMLCISNLSNRCDPVQGVSYILFQMMVDFMRAKKNGQGLWKAQILSSTVKLASKQIFIGLCSQKNMYLQGSENSI